MGSKTPPNKTLQDIADCVYDLKRESLDGKKPINDDSAILHHFQEKLELILLFGLIEKPGLLGPKKSYWNYICACFTSSKKIHDGIHFVKSTIPLKTHLGRGRAFIRFCLAQKCLADTLQCCFMNQKISREFYSERSLLVQEKLWSFLVTLLYELNELNFDLSTGHTELDTSWPKFARKLFTSSESLSFLQKDMSADVFHSRVSQDQHNMTKYSHSKSLTALNSDTSSNIDVSTNVPELSDQYKELPQENIYLQDEVKSLKEEKLKLQTDIQYLKLQFEILQQQMNISFKGNCNESERKKALSSSFNGIEPKDHFNVNFDEVKEIISCDDDSFTEVPSVKSKIKNSDDDIPEWASQQGLININSLQITDTFNCRSSSKDLQIRNICVPRNHVYISELLLKFKTVIDDIEDIIQKSEVSLAVPHISHLKRIRGCLEDIF